MTPTVYAILDDRLGVSPELIGPHVALGDDLAIDSLDLLDVVIDLESVFRICVPEREIDRLQTVADLVHVVAKYLWERDHPEPFTFRPGPRLGSGPNARMWRSADRASGVPRPAEPARHTGTARLESSMAGRRLTA